MEYKFDGKIHALRGDYAYISEIIKDDEFFGAVEDLKQKMMTEFIDYQLKNNMQLCVAILRNHFNHIDPHNNYQFIYKPAWMHGILAQNGVISMKFERIKGDGLDDEKA